MNIDFKENKEELEIGDMFKDDIGDVYFMIYNDSLEEFPIKVISMEYCNIDRGLKAVKDATMYYNIVKIIKNKDILITDNTLK